MLAPHRSCSDIFLRYTSSFLGTVEYIRVLFVPILSISAVDLSSHEKHGNAGKSTINMRDEMNVL